MAGRVYHFLVFSEREVVLAKSNDENDGGDALEAVYPFLALWPLSADIEHSVARNTQIKIISKP